MNAIVHDTLAPAAEANPDFSIFSPAVAAPQLTFDEAMDRFTAAREANDLLSMQQKEAWAKINAAAPMPAILKGPTKAWDYTAESYIFDDRSLTDARKGDLIVALREWKNRQKIASEPYADLIDREDDDDLLDAVADAGMAVISRDATSLSELAEQFRVAIGIAFLDFNDESPDAEHTVQRLLDGDLHERIIGRLYQSVLRLAGVDTPAAAAEPFDAVAWVEAFEAFPGYEARRDGLAFVEQPDDGPRRESCPEADRMWMSLSKWQKKEVYAFAKDREEAPAEEWIARWRDHGGSFLLSAGELYFGGSVADEDQKARAHLEAELDADDVLHRAVRRRACAELARARH